VGQITATESDEVANGPTHLYIINQDWANPSTQGSFTTILLEGADESDVVGVTNGAVAGRQFEDGCLAFGSDPEGVPLNFGPTLNMFQEGNGRFDATIYLKPELIREGWKAQFVSDVPEPGTLVLLGLGGMVVGLLQRSRQSF
jgi:hypothetical protein